MSESSRSSLPPGAHLVIISGMSGAGRSTALHALEDLGFFCVDNLPTPLVPNILELCAQGSIRRIGLGIDVRIRSFLQSFGDVVEQLRSQQGVRLRIVFLDASDRALLSRFSATRRPHPLASIESDSRAASALLGGIELERQRLGTVRENATDVIDTTSMTVHELRRRVVDLFGPGAPAQPHLRIRVLSFGFKYGPPVDADLMFDVRFLPNPYFVPALRDSTGLSEAVQQFVFKNKDSEEFFEKMYDLVRFSVPKYEREGKAYLTIAIGCTGGRHRSVALAERLAAALKSDGHAKVEASHRDIFRDTATERASEVDIIGGCVRGSGRDADEQS